MSVYNRKIKSQLQWPTGLIAGVMLLFCLGGLPAKAQSDLQFSQTDCTKDVDEPYGYPEKILKKEVKNSMLTVTVTIADLCCSTFSGGYTFTDNQLQLTYKSSDDENVCFCACAYELSYTLPAPQSNHYSITINGRALKL